MLPRIDKLIIILFFLFATASPVFAIEQSRETPVVRAVRLVSPAVVNIGSEYQVRYRTNPFSDFGLNPFFDNFFKDFFDHRFERSQKRSSLGSGVIIDGKRGFILTNAHVIAQTDTITVTLNDEREFKAKIVGADPDSDLAVLRIESEKTLPAIEMGSSGNLMIGETVIAIGNPFGFSHTVTTGVVSAIDRSVRTEKKIYHNFIQIDASINPGNSGGPLLNINGELIGINTAIYAKAQGIGFAIPIDTAKKIVADLIKYGEVVPAWLGIEVQNIDPRLSGYLKIPENRGVIVKDTYPASPAQRSGVQNGDVIFRINSQDIGSVEDYRSAMKTHAEGDALTIHFWRAGMEQSVIMTASVFPIAGAEDLAFRMLGVRVKGISTSKLFSGRTEKTRGVVITQVRNGSYLGNIGVEPGDIIRQVDEIPIDSVEDFKKAAVKYRHRPSVVILLYRQDRGYYITIKLS